MYPADVRVEQVAHLFTKMDCGLLPPQRQLEHAFVQRDFEAAGIVGCPIACSRMDIRSA